MSVLSRIHWVSLRRMRLRAHGSHAHWTSVCSESKLLGRNRLAKGVILSQSELGRYSYVAANSRVVNASIGAFCSIGPNVLLGGLGVHPTRWLSTHPAFYSTRLQAGGSFSGTDKFEEMRRTFVANDVWIGANVVVLDGITIGNGAIIAAGAVVVRDVPPYAIVGGVPGKVLKYRFAQDVIDSLSEWCWWDLPDVRLAGLAEAFCSQDAWSRMDIDRLRAAHDQPQN